MKLSDVVRINPSVLLPHKDAKFALAGENQLNHAKVFRSCTWGDATQGGSYGLTGNITKVNCILKSKSERSVIGFKENWLYLNDYSIFVDSPYESDRSDYRLEVIH